MISRARHGFTIVEMLIVVVVIAMLTVITAAIFLNVQVQARDTQMRDAADKFADAVSLYALKTGAYPEGGAQSGVVYLPYYTGACKWSGDVEVSPPNEGWQSHGSYVTAPGDTCTVGDTLVEKGYLNADFFKTLPENPKTKSNLQVFYTLPCGTFNINPPFYTLMYTGMLLLYPLSDPEDEDIDEMHILENKCYPGLDTSDVRSTFDPLENNYGLNSAILIEFSV